MTENELYHHGIPGQKWGIRRYQNEDGSYTAAGKKRRYFGGGQKGIDKLTKKLNSKSEVERIHSSMAENERKKSDNLKAALREKPTKNPITKLLAKYELAVYDRNSKMYDNYAKIGRRSIQRTLNKIGKYDNLKVSVYLADIWGIPYDYYEVKLKN